MQWSVWSGGMHVCKYAGFTPLVPASLEKRIGMRIHEMGRKFEQWLWYDDSMVIIIIIINDGN